MTFSILRGFSLQQKVVTPATVPEYATSSQNISSVLLNSPSFLLQHHSASFPRSPHKLTALPVLPTFHFPSHLLKCVFSLFTFLINSLLTGLLVPVGLDWGFPSAYVLHAPDSCASSSPRCRAALETSPCTKTALQLCPQTSEWRQAPTPASTTPLPDKSPEPLRTPQNKTLTSPLLQAISWSRIKEIKAESVGVFQHFSVKEKISWGCPTLFTLVSSSRTESFARNFYLARSSYLTCIIFWCGMTGLIENLNVVNWLFQSKGKICHPQSSLGFIYFLLLQIKACCYCNVSQSSQRMR